MENVIKTNGYHQMITTVKQYFASSTGENKSYSFGTAWGCENYARIFIFGWTILLNG